MITVKLKYLRISPRKARLATDIIRGKTVDEAEALLEFARKKAIEPLRKLLKSAVATAEHDFQKNKSNLYISKIFVDEGPTLKRSRFRGGGRIFSILKRTCHVTISLDEIKTTEKAKAAKATKAAETKKEIKKRGTEIKKPSLPADKQDKRIKMLKPRLRETAKKMFRRKAF